MGSANQRFGLVVFLVACLCSLFFAEVESKRRHRGRLPIDGPLSAFGGSSSGHNGARVGGGHAKKKASECRFGDRRYELEQTWNPDLGPPFGVMHCVHCECVPIHKKRRIIGRVRCKNIKSECPVPNCPEPVLLPGRCCKVCPGQTSNPDLNIEVDLAREEEEKNGRHYAALMSPPAGPTVGQSQASLASGSEQSASSPSVSATGRFHFRRKTLTYSIVTSPAFGWPKLLTFLDAEKNIIEEFPLQMTPFQNATGKTCGSWKRLPRRYRRQLRRDELFVQLTNADGRAVSGRMGKHYGLSSEMFSGLLQADSGPAAASPIVSISSPTGSVHANILLNSALLATNDQEENIPIWVTFETTHNGEKRIIEEEMKIPKVKMDTTTIDFKTVFDPIELSALGQGTLQMRIRTPFHSVQGFLTPKFSCDFFDCVLSPLETVDGDEPADTTARGIAWILVRKSGHMDYHIRIDQLQGEVTSLHIDNGRKSRRLLKIVHDLMPTLQTNLTDIGTTGTTTGWANGTIRLSAVDLESLYKADLFINLATSSHERELRGRLVPQLMGIAQESVSPILLRGDRSGTLVSAIAWANVDTTCTLNYQVRMAGLNSKSESELVLKDFPMDANYKNLALMPGRTTDLDKFKGLGTTGHKDQIHKLTMARLDSGDASLVILGHHEGHAFELEGRLASVRAPIDCLPRYARNELELMPGYLSDLGEARPEVERELATRCLYEGGIYEDGAQWAATHTKCQMCSCKRGLVVCDAMVCPKPQCQQPIILEGECCATCEEEVPDGNSSQGCFFEGDKMFHKAGTKWHPYIPPFGFSRCAVCTCEASTLKVTCSSKQCPSLSCPKESQVRPDQTACCKVCKDPPPASSESEAGAGDLRNPEQPHDMGRERTDGDVLADGGCKLKGEVYENGALWHPKILPFGESQCVYCKCKDGYTKCKRQECPRLTCKYKVQDKHACCARCAANRAEVKKARKIRRRMKLRNIRRMRRLQRERMENDER